MALLATVLLGKAWLAVAVVMIGAAPLAGLSAYVASAAVTRSTLVRLWAAVAYALSPSLAGAVAGGRLDVVAAVILLPVTARALTAAIRPGAGWNRAAGAAVMLAMVCAFAPVVWPLALVAGLAVVAVGVRPAGPAARRLFAVLAGVMAVLLPWSLSVLAHPALVVRGAGLPESFAGRRPLSPADLVLLHPGGPGLPPVWVLAPYLLAALVGLARTRLGPVARAGVATFVVGLVGALVTSRLTGAQPGLPDTRYWTGAALAVAAVGVLTAATVAVTDAGAALGRHSFGWRQQAAALLACAAVVATAVAGVGWMVRGAGGSLTSGTPRLLPIFAAEELRGPTSPRVLVLRADGRTVRYDLVRSASGPRLGTADLSSTPPSGLPAVAGRHLAGVVARPVAGDQEAAADLARFGGTMVLAPVTDAARLRRTDAVDA